MKKLLILFLATLTCNLAIAQNEEGEFNEKLTFSIQKEHAYTNTLIWIAESFNDANNVIKLKDKEEGIIVVKGFIKDADFSTSFTMTFRFMETECSVKIKNWKEINYNYTYADTSNCYTKACKKNIENWSIRTNELGSSFLKEISNKINE